ncbi:MAG: aminotransferase class I/II-fold pyridoxal phosphate-dependent enzyme [Clostridia bacterium]|nr:aminotransferase class I/II-fold pyridoxal phosphate-dependent enzyme [Clostridia bacterium]
MKKAPIIENLLNHGHNNPFSGHTPGHKGGQIIPPLLEKNWPREIWQFDLTEIENMDNLHNPTGCIREAQRMTAELFNAKSSYFLVNGTSVGIQAAILALAYQSPIFVPRNVHKSVYSGLILADAQPVYLPVTYDKNWGFPLGIEPETLKHWIEKYPHCKTLIITNPTYQGLSYKIEEIMAVALDHGLKVIIDEAHGSHLALHKDLPPSALSLGAHIVIQSWHKTLPVLTQASVLHLGKNYSGPDISQYLKLLQTTSPSYLLLASLDGCRAFLADNISELIDEKIIKIKKIREDISSLSNIKMFQAPDRAYKTDPFKLCLSSPKVSGYQLAELLRERFGIYPEMAEERYCLIILAVVHDQRFLERLWKALKAIDDELEQYSPYPFLPVGEQDFIPQTKMLIREAFFRPKERVILEKALGRTAGDFLIKYPPGIPLVVPGEVIDEAVFQTLQNSISEYKIEDGISVVIE